MLNEEGNKIDIKINRSNSRKELKKTNCTCSTLFVFLCRCFAQLQRCFVGLKRQTS